MLLGPFYRLIEEELKKRPQAVFPPSPQPATKSTKRKNASDDEDNEVRAFKKRPKAAVNKPMTLPPVDQARKQALAMAQAAADPNASFADRVAQFDHLAQISQKRKITTICTISDVEMFRLGSNFMWF